MSYEIEIELLQDRVDSLMVANEELRERASKVSHEMIKIIEQNQQLEQKNRELGAHIDRLRLHIQQGIEL